MRLIAKLFDLNTTSLIQTKRRCFSCYYILNIICHNHPLVCPSRVHVLLDVSRFSRRALSSSSNDLSNFYFKPTLNYLIKLIRTLFYALWNCRLYCFENIDKLKWNCLFKMSDWFGFYCNKVIVPIWVGDIAFSNSEIIY